MKHTVLFLALLFAATATACSRSDGGYQSASDQPSAEASTVGAPTDDCQDFTGKAKFGIDIADYAFTPPCITADGSASITVNNGDSVDHTFTIDGTQVDATVPAGEIFNGESAGLKPGEYEFHCRFHPSMTGTLTVN